MSANDLNLYLSIFPLLWFYRLLLSGMFMLAGPSEGGTLSDDEDDDMNDTGAVFGV